MAKWNAPLDPNCPGAMKVMDSRSAAFEDPLTVYYGAYDVVEDIYDVTVNKHRQNCGRCQEYGAANIEVVED